MDQKLSLVAQYDDLVYLSQQLLNNDLIEDKITKLLKNCEKQRLLWLLERKEVLELRELVQSLKNENNNLTKNLKSIKQSYIKELNLNDKLKNDNNKLIKKLTQIQNYLLDDNDICKDSKLNLNNKLFSSFNLNKLNTSKDSNLSLSDLEYDKTEDELIDSNRLLNNLMNSHDTSIKQTSNKNDTKFDNLDDLQNHFKDNDINFDQQFENILNDDIDDNKNLTPKKPLIDNLTSFTNQSTNKLSTLSQSLLKKSRQLQSQLQNEFKIDKRPHCFVIKKIFRPEKCGPCGGSIGFYQSAYHCRDCRAICHITCKDNVPLPCIPFISSANIGKQGRLVLISDFVSPNSRPCIPALIIHCTSEIERRGLDVIGIYRVPGSEKEVKELMDKIIKSKHGIPKLTNIEIHVLCNVIKKFLNHLDEALISRIVWRDFVEASNILDENERKIRFKEAILNLPIANRDTLAFMMLHLQKVSSVTINKMSILNLAKLFGPTILGYSMLDPPSTQLTEEIKKQTKVVEILLNLDSNFWKSILNLEIDYPIHQDRSRPSVGSRLIGGKINSGILDALPTFKKNKNHNIKPLF